MLKSYYISIRNLHTDGDGSLCLVAFDLLLFVQGNHYNAVEDKCRQEEHHYFSYLVHWEGMECIHVLSILF